MEKNNIIERYEHCTMKEKIAIITAVSAFLFGWGLTIAGFIVPPLGSITDGVLWCLGQALIYAASVFGITGYFSSETIRMKRDMNIYLDKRLKEENDENEQ